jgi:hypothetical protein
MSPGCPGAAASSLVPGSRACLQERASRPLGSPAGLTLVLLLGADDCGDLGGGHVVPVVVHVLLDRGPRRWERPETAAPGPGEARARPGPVRACR